MSSPTDIPVATTKIEEHHQQNEEEVELPDRNLPTSTSGPPTSTPTITPAPTLSPEQEGDFLSSLMSDNGGCELPCWWGVTPGQTGEQEARDLFASQGVDDWTFSDDYRIVGIGYPRAGNVAYFRDVIVRFWVEDNIIQYIGVEGSYRRELNSLLVLDWQSYSPSEILSRFGVPSYIELAKVENSPYYRLGLSYELLGIEISYIVPFQVLDNSKEEICFNLQNVDFIGLSLYPPERTKDIPVGVIPNRLDSYLSWETTTGLSREEFQQLLENDSGLRCVEVD
ncbi:MAG: hypothetical protein BroJett015_28940 [Chloroflexota bacterium]|nr:MAG: hypothetical protein BroJett015_28940 [Chloroflexota bacterium]